MTEIVFYAAKILRPCNSQCSKDVCVCVCVCIYIYIFIHIYVYKYTYTFTYIKFFFPQQSRSKETPKEYLLFWLLGSQSSGAKSYMTHFTTLLIKTDVLN